MKIPRTISLRSLTVIDHCLQWLGKPSSTPRSDLNHRQQPSTARSASGYTLQEVQSLWNSGDITDQSTYIVLTHGLLPPRETLRYVYSGELLNPQIPLVPKPSQSDTEAVRYIEQGQSFVVNAPQGFRVYVFCSGPSLVEGRTLPEELGSGAASVSLHVARHTIGSTKADNSVDHTFSFVLRLVSVTRDLPLISSGVLRFVARAELIRI